MADVKILMNLVVLKRAFGKIGGARLPQATPVATPLYLCDEEGMADRLMNGTS